MSNMCDEKPPCKHVTTLHTYKTEYNADSVEWCRHEPHQNLFVCANYQLKKTSNDKNKRIGCILLFIVTPESLLLQQTIYTAAVLDQKWCPNLINDQSVLAVVNAEKTIEIYALNSEAKNLELITSHQINTDDDDDENLLLSVDWSTGKYESNEPDLVCSDSKGNIHRFKFKNNELLKEGTWHGHQYEAWITGFYYWDPNVFFSGSDDCYFLKFDKRVDSHPVSRNRSHEAGVTSMHSNSSKEYVIATGSYDSHVRLWDIRNMKTCTDSVKMPGTLWRLKWDPLDHNFLLAACMWGGVHIIDDQLSIIDSYYQHENIAYGADWSHQPIDSDSNQLIASCSFYDNLLCVSHVKLKE